MRVRSQIDRSAAQPFQQRACGRTLQRQDREGFVAGLEVGLLRDQVVIQGLERLLGHRRGQFDQRAVGGRIDHQERHHLAVGVEERGGASRPERANRATASRAAPYSRDVSGMMNVLLTRGRALSTCGAPATSYTMAPVSPTADRKPCAVRLFPAPPARSRFRRRLLAWYRRHRRDLPWRRTGDPYRILVSEIMLQQTQVDRVIPKYHEFLDRYPTLESLAGRTPEEVTRLWYPLGYNIRPINLRGIACEAGASYGGRL